LLKYLLKLPILATY